MFPAFADFWVGTARAQGVLDVLDRHAAPIATIRAGRACVWVNTAANLTYEKVVTHAFDLAWFRAAFQ